jgi:AcrR family transcriptional regulator
MAHKDAAEKILDAALALFREQGFESTTMRQIAEKAGVATGLAYYYFQSKDAIVLAFYQRAQLELPEVLEAAHKERDLAPRLRALVEAKLRYFAPNRLFLGALMGHAADPHNALSPFGPGSATVREADIAQFDRALKETKTKVHPDLAPHMARILWFYQMGMILFWIYDRSANQKRTKDLINASVPVVVTLIKLSSLPLVGPMRKNAVKIIELLTA